VLVDIQDWLQDLVIILHHSDQALDHIVQVMVQVKEEVQVQVKYKVKAKFNKTICLNLINQL
jgi:hypothetical protein